MIRLKIHMGLKKTPFELHHGQKPRTELTNLIKDGKSFLSKWSELSVSAESRPKDFNLCCTQPRWRGIGPFSHGRTKTEQKTMTEKSPKQLSVSICSFKFFEKILDKKSLEGRF